MVFKGVAILLFKTKIMNRKDFLKKIAITSLSIPFMKLNALGGIGENLPTTKKMPILFVGHGSPMNAILDNSFSRKWKELGNQLQTPTAILVISAHWLTEKSTKVTAMEMPKTIHDFGGFPKKLFEQEYPVKGSPSFAKETIDLVKSTPIQEDFEWGLDHGTWSILKPMFPKADIPVFQISIDYDQPMEYHYQIGKEISKLREKGVLIIGSGNIVHNLYELEQRNTAYDWAQEFDTKITEFINKGDFEAVMNFQKLGNIAKKAHPTYDHFLPLIYTLGASNHKEQITYFNDQFDLGSISMRSLLIH